MSDQHPCCPGSEIYQLPALIYSYPWKQRGKIIMPSHPSPKRNERTEIFTNKTVVVLTRCYGNPNFDGILVPPLHPSAVPVRTRPEILPVIDFRQSQIQ